MREIKYNFICSYYILLLFFTLFSFKTSFANTFTVINSNDSGAGSLRQAITDANVNTGGPDVIIFNQDTSILLLSHMTPLTDTVWGTHIDGITGSHIININGYKNVSTTYSTIVIQSDSNTITGLNLYKGYIGVNVTAGNYNIIQGCQIGVTAGFGFGGIDLYLNASSNTVGGTTASERNIISNNTSITPIFGVRMIGTASTNNVIIGNYIGTDSTGNSKLANKIGVVITSAASCNTIGGTTTNKRNIISGNIEWGINIG